MWFLNLGIFLGIFGLVYMSIPLYRKFCANMGIAGNTDQKDFSTLNTDTKKRLIGKKFKVIFESEADPEMGWEFEPEQSEMFVHPGETALMFYRAFNSTNKPIVGVATYTVYPEFAAQYFAKIQCFCFNQQLISSKEELLLPLYFYFEPEIDEDINLQNVESIRIHYRFFFSKSQDLAKMVQDQRVTDLNHRIRILEKRKGRPDIAPKELKKTTKDLEAARIELANLYG
jgi:cytochrome c oxidase assembly protein subunit 11